MSKVRIRTNGGLWEPISYDAGAVPNKVNGLTAGLVFKSICGVTSPVTPRYIRDAGNANWIPLDEASTLPFIRSVSYDVQTANYRVFLTVPSDTEEGDLLVAMMTSEYAGTASQCAMTASPAGWTRRTRSNVNYLAANSAVFTRKATAGDVGGGGVVTITVSSNTNVSCTGLIFAMGNVSGTTWDTYIPDVGWTTGADASRSFFSKASVTASNANTTAVQLWGVTDGRAAPVSVRAGNFVKFSEVNAGAGQVDMGVATLSLPSGGASGVGDWNFGTSSGTVAYASNILMVRQ